MSGITLYPKDFTQENLNIVQVLILKIIFTKDKPMFNALVAAYGSEFLFRHLIDLEGLSYIKLMFKELSEMNLDDIVTRQSTDNLFNKEVSAVDEVLEYLNFKITDGNKNRKGFSSKSASNRKFIAARIAEGHTVEDMKAVIDYKVKEWANTKWDMYLRPETLFNPTKFSGYLVMASKNLNKEEDWNIEKV